MYVAFGWPLDNDGDDDRRDRMRKVGKKGGEVCSRAPNFWAPFRTMVFIDLKECPISLYHGYIQIISLSIIH
jgi:hypothetical protein